MTDCAVFVDDYLGREIYIISAAKFTCSRHIYDALDVTIVIVQLFTYSFI